mmetsp:Transcript_11316/g.19053  ORF Transcript_11316/g.19053 Transcript_11316/m.19053 type:complete len:208 (-) Transcript_11316:124-747(-)
MLLAHRRPLINRNIFSRGFNQIRTAALFSTTHSPKVALYAGSFDPPSSGHLDIIQRAFEICDKLIIGIAINPLKKPVFSYNERKSLLQKISTDYKERIEVMQVEGLLADFILDNNIDFQVRGIRSFSDFDSEFTMGLINRELCHKETVFLLANKDHVHISSSRIRELAMFNKKLDDFVPKEIEEEVYTKLFDHYKDYPTFSNGKHHK